MSNSHLEKKDLIATLGSQGGINSWVVYLGLISVIGIIAAIAIPQFAKVQKSNLSVTYSPASTSVSGATVQTPPEQKPMSSAASPVDKRFEVDPSTEAKLHQTALQIYREYPFLDGDNETANSKAMSDVSQTCADLVKRGMPLTEALRSAASQVGPKYGPSDEKKRTKEVYGMSPMGNVPIDSFCIMLSKPVPPYNPNKQ